jgi:5'(3')-deoxyribonucleotidase
MKPNTQKPVILRDMDGTLFDFQTPFYDRVVNCEKLPLDFRTLMSEQKNRTRIKIRELFEGEVAERKKIQKIVEGLYQTEEFYAGLKLYPGLADTFYRLAKDFTHRICSAPSVANCGSEAGKRSALLRELWPDAAEIKNIIFTGDKTAARGDILIDDNTTIEGYFDPSRKQILVDQPHNQGSPLPRLYIGEQEKRLDIIHETRTIKPTKIHTIPDTPKEITTQVVYESSELCEAGWDPPWRRCTCSQCDKR